MIFKNGEFVSSFPLLPDLNEKFFTFEIEFQKILRINDDGLPLPIAEKMGAGTSPVAQEIVTPDLVSTFGKWEGGSTLLLTEQNDSIISIPFRGRFLRLLAMAHPNAHDPIKVAITFNEKALPNNFHTALVRDDKKGNTVFDLNKTIGIYDLIQSDREIVGIIKLNFINAFDNGAVFYGFRIA